MTHIDPELLKPRDISAFKRVMYSTQSKQLDDMSKRVIAAREYATIEGQKRVLARIEAKIAARRQIEKSIMMRNEEYKKRMLAQVEEQVRIEMGREARDRAAKYWNDGVVKMHEIVATVAAYFGLSVIDIKSQRRLGKLLIPRHIAYYLSKQLTLRSFPEIGHYFYRDHTTILHGVRKITKLIETDAQLAADIAALRLIIEPKQEMLEAAE